MNIAIEDVIAEFIAFSPLAAKPSKENLVLVQSSRSIDNPGMKISYLDLPIVKQ